MNDSRGRLFSIAAGQNLPAIRVCSVGSFSDCQLHPFEPARFHFKFHPIPVGCAFLPYRRVKQIHCSMLRRNWSKQHLYHQTNVHQASLPP